MIQSQQPLVSIVLVTWNGETRLRQYLHSIAELRYTPVEVIVVDNGSSDNTVQYLTKTWPEYRVLRSSENLGTAGGSNLGARVARGKYIFFTSNDMIYDPALLDAMAAPMEKDSSIGAVACKVRYMTADGSPGDRLDSAGGGLDLFGFPCIRGNREPDRGQYDQPGEIFFAFGCSILVRRALFTAVGGYDNRLFTLADDIDLCWRLRLMGYKIYYEPRALLFHRGSATIGSAFKRSQTRYLSERHTLRMLLKNYRAVSLGWVLPACSLILLAEIWFYLFSGNSLLAWSILRAVGWNLVNLRDTLAQRRVVQKRRRLSDRRIQARMMRWPNKFRELQDFMQNRRSDYWRNFFGKAGTDKLRQSGAHL